MKPINLKNLLLIKEAINVFTANIKAGNIILPENLKNVREDSTAFCPSSVVYNQKIIPIDYDEKSNLIILKNEMK